MATTTTTTSTPAGAVLAPPRASRSRRAWRDDLRALPYLAPWLIGLGVFFCYPLAATIGFSFAHYDQFNPPQWVGLRNWIYVFTQYPEFYTALRNTLWLVVVMVPVRAAFGLLTASLALRANRLSGFLRTAYYVPYLAPPVAATLAFVFLLNPATGPVNQVLHRLHLPAPAWFTDPAWAKPALTLLALWGIGDLMIIFLAALQDVPRELYEAASLDGAGAVASFRHITLPAVRPIVLFAVVTGVIEAMQYYTQALVAGKVASGSADAPGAGFDPGYPGGSTLTLPQLVYSRGFQNFDTGSACVISVVLLVLALAVTVVLLRTMSGFLTEPT